eukprot:scaffold2044_cov206-Cylindrotheca_fusiformis.AAC.4
MLQLLFVLFLGIGEVKAQSSGHLRGLTPMFNEPCIAVVGDYETAGHNDTYSLYCETSMHLFYEVRGVTSKWIKKKMALGELISGVTELDFSNEAVLSGDYQITTESPPQLLNGEGRRKLNVANGVKSVLVVRAIGGGDFNSNIYTEEQYGASIFGNNVNLRTQMNACSYGKLQFKPTEFQDDRINGGVVTVTVDVDPSVSGVKAFETALIKDLYQMFNVDTATAIADHVMLCYPDKTIEKSPAYAYLNTWLTA